MTSETLLSARIFWHSQPKLATAVMHKKKSTEDAYGEINKIHTSGIYQLVIKQEGSTKPPTVLLNWLPNINLISLSLPLP